MTYHGVYMDGQSARRYDVTLTYANKRVVITDLNGECLTDWDVSNIVPVDKVYAARPLILKSGQKGRERLHIEDDVTKQWLNNIMPGLHRRSVYKSEARLAWYLAGGISAFALFLYLILPYVAQMAVYFVPMDWENKTFKNAGLETAKRFGAKKICTSPAGLQVLDDVLVRLMGPEKAKTITLHVVDHKMVNAFATPGNNVILLRGLIDKASNAEEVIGVLAHELGHVERRHPMQGAIRSAGVTLLLSLFSGGNIGDVAALLAETSYSRDNEREADLYALEVMRREQIRTEGLAGFFTKLDKENHAYESVLRLISTHPMSAERADLLRSYKGGGDALTSKQWRDLRQVCSQKEKI
ncbi:MAG: M48 family metallopeptidase [Methylocystaceae bacterium]|nr:M48 family metallopeptidase [Methylocystaceae bacterium]